MKLEYDNALKEYIELGHMKPSIYNPNTSSNTHYYLPHHAAVKPQKFELFLIHREKRTATG